MIVSVYNIITANSVFTKILQYEFTAKQSFIIGRTLRALSNEAEIFNKTREEMLKKYAEFNENGEMIIENNNVKIRNDKLENFQHEINELLYSNLEINVKPIPIEWFDNVRLTPQEMLVLEPFISVEE